MQVNEDTKKTNQLLVRITMNEKGKKIRIYIVDRKNYVRVGMATRKIVFCTNDNEG